MTNTIDKDLHVASYQEKHRPQLHFTPATMWCNDPNGLVYFEGEYHLFYQYHPESMVWGPMHWGHAVSTDLIHWEHLPIALFPDEQGTIFSGGAVVDKDNTSGLVPGGGLIAMYTYHREEEKNNETLQIQTQAIAYSQDKGRTWTKYDGNPVIPAVAKDFRDPKVFWYEPEQRWQMVIAVGDCMQFYKSENLLEWDYQSSFSGGEVRAVWEVPDLLRFEVEGQEKWVLLVSIGEHTIAGGSGIQYFIGDFDGTTFTSDDQEIRWFDYGSDNYAGTTWTNEPSGRPMYIGWMNNWFYANKIPTSPWRGAMTVPRELKLETFADELCLTQHPIGLDVLVSKSKSLEPQTIADKLSVEHDGLSLELNIEVALKDATAVKLSLFEGTPDETVIDYDRTTKNLVFTRPIIDIEKYQSCADVKVPLFVDGDVLRLELILDHSSVELFAHGRCVTARLFPESQKCNISLSGNGSFELKEFQLNTLKSIW